MKNLLLILAASISFSVFAQEDTKTLDANLPETAPEVIPKVQDDVKKLEKELVVNLPSPEEAQLDEVDKAPEPPKTIPKELDKKEIHRSKSLVIYAVLLILLVGIITGVAHLFPNGNSEEKS